MSRVGLIKTHWRCVWEPPVTLGSSKPWPNPWPSPFRGGIAVSPRRKPWVDERKESYLAAAGSRAASAEREKKESLLLRFARAARRPSAERKGLVSFLYPPLTWWATFYAAPGGAGVMAGRRFWIRVGGVAIVPGLFRIRNRIHFFCYCGGADW